MNEISNVDLYSFVILVVRVALIVVNGWVPIELYL